MNLAKLFFYLFIVIKQFYFLESGSFQLGDLFLILSAVVVFVDMMKRKDLKEFWKIIDKDDWLFLAFTFLAFLVNGCYYAVYRDIHLLLSSAYFVYIAVGIVLFRLFIQDEQFLSRIRICFRADIYIQLLMFLTGLGRYRFEHRWCGTFNDPNQMAFFLMMCLFFSFLLQEMRGKHSCWELVDWVVGIFLLVLSKSVGITLGFLVFGITYALWRGYGWIKAGKKGRNSKRKARNFLLVVAAMLAVIVLTVCGAWKMGDDFHIFTRISLKLEMLFHDGFLDVLAERGIDRIWKEPLPLIYGAGDGAFSRYAAMGSIQAEIHSTLLGLWYCYGILPFGLICCWIYKCVRHLPPVAYTIYFALLCESMFLVNYRQPFFWMMFVLGLVWQRKERKLCDIADFRTGVKYVCIWNTKR